MLFYKMKCVVLMKRFRFNECEKEMEDYSFLRIYQNFLVNLRHIKNVADYKVILSNNQQLIIPKIRYKSVKNAFIAYLGEL